MRRSARFLLNATTALSVLLCLATIGLWLRSYRFNDDAWYSPRRGVNYRVATRPGLLLASRTVLVGRTSDLFSDGHDRGPGRSFTSRPRVADPGASPFTAEGSSRALQWLGFDYLSRDQSRPSFGTLTFRRAAFPLWLPALVAAVLPVARTLRGARRKWRRSRRRCPACGYDLRATPERCPECGTIPTL
ncbi:MAG TPA: hypothetical protein VH475_17165 [Tepidisphaeraceae bacterium]|jgi:hypothetical protein